MPQRNDTRGLILRSECLELRVSSCAANSIFVFFGGSLVCFCSAVVFVLLLPSFFLFFSVCVLCCVFCVLCFVFFYFAVVYFLFFIFFLRLVWVVFVVAFRVLCGFVLLGFASLRFVHFRF